MSLTTDLHAPASSSRSRSRPSPRTGSAKDRSPRSSGSRSSHGNRKAPAGRAVPRLGRPVRRPHRSRGRSGRSPPRRPRDGRRRDPRARRRRPPPRSEMTGGDIRVEGDAGDWVGGEMKGGLIHIAGSAGDHAGAAYPGSRRGMTDGTILIEGSAGDQPRRIDEARAARRRRLLRRGRRVRHDRRHDPRLRLVRRSIRAPRCAGARSDSSGRSRRDCSRPSARAGRFRPLFLRLIAASSSGWGSRSVGGFPTAS